MSVKISLPENVSRIINMLNSAGYEAYAVGGCVRDTLINRVPGDWDITTSAKPEQVKSLFRRTIDTGIQHGTVTIMFGKEGYEVTTYRIDGVYEDGRHPKEVAFTSNLLEDLKRRDFTINAMAYCEDSGIVDEFDGLKDLEDGIIRAVGDAEERFNEDALRILRALRFAAQLGYDIEDNTVRAICKLKDNLRQISAERIRVELTKLLLSPHPEMLDEAFRLGVTGVILPQYDAYTKEEREGLIDSLKKAVLSDAIPDKREEYLRYAILLRNAGSKGAHTILRELKFDNETIRCVTVLIDNFDKKPDEELPSIRRSIAGVGVDLVSTLVRLWRLTDKKGSYQTYIDYYEKAVDEILRRGDCISMKELAVSGRDLINELNMKPGKELGDVLGELLERVMDNPLLNEKQQLIQIATTIYREYDR